MNIVLVMSEASLWKPQFVQGIIQHISETHKIAGTVLTSFRHSKVSRFKHLTRYFIMLGPGVFLIMAMREIYHSLADMVDGIIPLPNCHSIRGVCRRYAIPTISTDNVNKPEIIKWIRQFNPDIILSSGNQIFGKRILSVPKIACLNRHTSLLPAYKGIYPIFWCLLNEEPYVGVSIHTMTEKIDRGIVIAQRRLEVSDGDTFFSLFEKCFELSVYAVIDAIQKIEDNDMQPVTSGYPESYYSYPAWKDVREFRRKGKKILF